MQDWYKGEDDTLYAFTVETWFLQDFSKAHVFCFCWYLFMLVDIYWYIFGFMFVDID